METQKFNHSNLNTNLNTNLKTNSILDSSLVLDLNVNKIDNILIPNHLLNFDKIYINPKSKDSDVAQRFLKIFDKDKIIFTENPDNKNLSPTGTLSPKEFDLSKKNIFITPYQGQFFKRCPGNHQKMACCNYFVLNLGLQCNMNCSYCYLQSFINTKTMTIYSNIDDALIELKTMTEEFKGLTFRVGTGEVIDSLSLDPLTLYSHKLIDFFKDKPHLTLEFKTKSNLVDQFINQEHSNNVIVSWSVNPQHIIEKEEHLTASLNQRLEAAKKCLSKGFKIAFHIDPMIWHPNWKSNYKELIDRITNKFNPIDLPYISLGALRFQKEQRWMMKERFGLNSYVNTAELFEGKDKKLRYDQDLRNEMFKFIFDEFKTRNSKWNVFLCMETPETWLSAFDSLPKTVDGLETLFEPRKSF